MDEFTPERFHSDVETLMSGPSGQWMAKVITACDSLSAEEIESLSIDREITDVVDFARNPTGKEFWRIPLPNRTLIFRTMLRVIGLSDHLVTGLYALQNQGDTSEESDLCQVDKNGIEGVLSGIVQR